MEQISLPGEIILAIFLLVQVVYVLVTKFFNNKKPSCFFSSQDRSYLKELYDLHNVKDDDGRPIWYIPKALGDSLKDQTTILSEIILTQKEVAFILKDIKDEFKRLHR